MDVMAQDVLNQLNRIGVYKAIWVGHSMGGYVTMAAWRLAPERFSGIGFVCSNHRADSLSGRPSSHPDREYNSAAHAPDVEGRP